MNLVLLTATLQDIVATVSNATENIVKTEPYDIAFPNLNIFIYGLRNNFQAFGYTIAYYGVIVALAMIIGLIKSRIIQ